MSLASIHAAFLDPQLRRRVDSAAFREAMNQDDTDYGRRVLTGLAVDHSPLYWRVATDYEGAYYAALQAGRGAPGHDADIITDGNIAAAVAAGWPPDTAPLPPPGV